MSENISNNKRIAKNTILLYIRMIFLMLIGVYTSRVLLQALGIENYGIYNVVAGFLTMFSIITSSMCAAISRFITVELGKGDSNRLKIVFSTSVSVQLFMSLLIVLLIESFGVWFLNNEMNIPVGREVAAQWCLHCAALTTFIGLLNIPFNSAIIAHEKMSAFAYMTIFDAFWKLLVCYVIMISPIDKLITCSLLGVVVSIITTSLYWIYSIRCFAECSLRLSFHKGLFREMCGFAGWNFFGNTTWLLNTQGVNMLMNIFFGVVTNAARGVAVQVNGIIQQFVDNFMTALRPQITKLYASGEKNEAFVLACRGTRFSFYIMYIISLPLMIESHQILNLWLGTPPEGAYLFVVWTILSSFTTLLGNTLVTLQMAHGNIKHYQIWITVFGCLPFPLTWLAFKLGASSIVAYYIFVIVYWGLIFVRYYLVHGMTGIPARLYLLGVVAKTHIVGIMSAILPMVIYFQMSENIWRLIVVLISSFISSGVIIYLFGLDAAEKSFFNKKIFSKFKTFSNGN